MLAALFAMFSGALMPIQTSVNTRLRQSVGSPLMASFFSFLVGTCALVIATLVSSGQIFPAVERTVGHPWWLFTGGALGVVVLTGNIVLFPRVGSVQTVILPISGQIIMSLLIDARGLLNSPQVSLGPLRVAGALAVLVGAAAVVGALRPGRRQVAKQPGIWLWRGFGVFMGICSATQIAVNGRLGTILGSAVEAALVSFTVGTLTLLLLLILTRTPWQGVGKGPWWMWLGGILGATVIFATALLGPILGTGLTVVLMLLGMMTASLLIDTFGLIAGVRRRVGWSQVLGLLIIISGVALIRVV